MPKAEPLPFIIFDPRDGHTVAWATRFPDGSVAVVRQTPPRGTLREWWDSIDACRSLYVEQNGMRFKVTNPISQIAAQLQSGNQN